MTVLDYRLFTILLKVNCQLDSNDCKINVLTSYSTYCYRREENIDVMCIMALKREVRMSDRNKKCILLLVISLMAIIILENKYSEFYSKKTIKQQVKEKTELPLQSANNYFHEDDDECGNDQDFKRNDQLDQYLANRKQCLLKYCGDVCKTNFGSNKGIS